MCNRLTHLPRDGMKFARKSLQCRRCGVWYDPDSVFLARAAVFIAVILVFVYFTPEIVTWLR